LIYHRERSKVSSCLGSNFCPNK